MSTYEHLEPPNLLKELEASFLILLESHMGFASLGLIH
jgi:hypothetical protein